MTLSNPLFTARTGAPILAVSLLLASVALGRTGKQTMHLYENKLERIEKPIPLLADFPAYVEPMQYERRFLAPPVVDEKNGDLLVRSWRYWYNARGIVEMRNRLESKATAIVVVHPWGIDDGYGMPTPEPAGCAFFCTAEKNRLAHNHIRDVLNPFLRRLRGHVGAVVYSMPGVEDSIRRLLYASISTRPEQLNPAEGEKQLAALFARHRFEGQPLVKQLALDPRRPVRSYLDQTPSTDAGDHYNGPGYWDLPMPISRYLERKPADIVAYDGEGYAKVRDFLKSRGIRHILLLGYATDMCVVSTTCGYQNLGQDFNVFLVGDATMATFPGSNTPKYATQVALANAALRQMITQANWVKLEKGGGMKRGR